LKAGKNIMKVNQIFCGHSLEILKTFPNECIDMVITSPPYWSLRDYGVFGQLGLELTYQEYLDNLKEIFREVKRVLKKEGTCWVNLGDSYNENKCLLQIPSRFALIMTDELGFILRNEIIWHKPNAMPSSVNDRFTIDYEKLYFFVKSKKYYFQQQKEPMKTKDTNPSNGSIAAFGDMQLGLCKKNNKQDKVGRNDYTGFNARYVPPKDLMRIKRCVWSISTKNFKGAHYAVFPEGLIETPILAGCPEGGVVLDPFIGSGTTALVAKRLNRNYIGIDINPEYCKMSEDRLKGLTYEDKQLIQQGQLVLELEI
jgi:site-specific DNA-methyltransferase (adenine-specific)